MNFNDNKPIYRQIVDFCYAHILAGQWAPGERIPSVREMAGALMVNSHTVLKAYDYLQSRDIIFTRRGMGYFLADDAPEKVEADRRRSFFDDTLRSLFAEMDLLGISIDELVQHYRDRR